MIFVVTIHLLVIDVSGLVFQVQVLVREIPDLI